MGQAGPGTGVPTGGWRGEQLRERQAGPGACPASQAGPTVVGRRRGRGRAHRGAGRRRPDLHRGRVGRPPLGAPHGGPGRPPPGGGGGGKPRPGRVLYPGTRFRRDGGPSAHDRVGRRRRPRRYERRRPPGPRGGDHQRRRRAGVADQLVRDTRIRAAEARHRAAARHGRGGERQPGAAGSRHPRRGGRSGPGGEPIAPGSAARRGQRIRRGRDCAVAAEYCGQRPVRADLVHPAAGEFAGQISGDRLQRRRIWRQEDIIRRARPKSSIKLDAIRSYSITIQT